MKPDLSPVVILILQLDATLSRCTDQNRKGYGTAFFSLIQSVNNDAEIRGKVYLRRQKNSFSDVSSSDPIVENLYLGCAELEIRKECSTKFDHI